MHHYSLDRRDFLKLVAGLPVAYTFGCNIPKGVAPRLSPDESLCKLIRLLGPWSDEMKADDFIKRFMDSEHTVAPYLPDSGRSIQGLASRFPAGSISIDRIDLNTIPKRERALLVHLTKQLYSFIEVRFYLSGEPPWGECHAEYLRHTRPPIIH